MVDRYAWQRAWTWWLREIRALLPMSLLELCIPRRPRWEIALVAGGAVEIRDCAANGTYRVIRQFPSVAAFLQEAASQDVAPKNRRMIISVDVDRCFVHRLIVPAAARPQLPSLLKLELLRITPF